jgi:hypothetical protein
MRRCQFIGTLSRLCANDLWNAPFTSLRSGFRNSFVLDQFSSNTLIISVLFSQIVWVVEFTRPISRHRSGFIFSVFYLSYHFKFSFDSQNLSSILDGSHVITLSPVNCRSRNVEGNITYKVNYRYYCNFPGQ